MIVVHHLEYSQSFRIVWLLEELGMEYQLMRYKRNDDHSAPDEYKQLSPLGTSPTITYQNDDDNNNDYDNNNNNNETIILTESNAIIDFILDLSPKSEELRPSSSSIRANNNNNNNNNIKTRTDYLFWYHAAQGTLQSNISIDSLFRIIPTKTPFPISYIAKIISSKTQTNYLKPRFEKYLQLFNNKILKTKFYLLGKNLSAADITSIYPMDALLQRYPEYKEQFPYCLQWLNRIKDRPAFQHAQQKVQEDNTTTNMVALAL